jgi:hypothetical protein
MLSVTAFFTQDGGAPATGLALADVALYLTAIAKANGAATVIWDGTQHPSAEVAGLGLYLRQYSGEDTVLYDYVAGALYTGAAELDTDWTTGVLAAPVKTDAAGRVEISSATDKNTLDDLTLNPTLAISQAEALSVAEGDLALATYHEFSQTITSTSTDNLGTAVLALGIKVRATDADTAAILLVRSDTGLSRVNGAAYATPAHGTLTVSGSSGDWEITVTVTAAVAGLLESYSGRELPSELKNLTTDRAVWTGKTAVTSGIVKATA